MGVGHVAGFLSYIRHSDIVTRTTAKELGVLSLHLPREESRVKELYCSAEYINIYIFELVCPA